MPKITIYYSVSNGGDGSAYPIWMESEELAKWDQDNTDFSWGESCVGSITLESDSPIKCLDEIITKEGYFMNLLPWNMSNDIDKKLIKYVKKFFPNGLPKFTVKLGKQLNNDHVYNEIYVDDRCVLKHFIKHNSESRQFLEDYINSINHLIK